MTSPTLGPSSILKAHSPSKSDIQAHISRATNLIADAEKTSNSLDGRFDNAYGASHALLVAAIKMHGLKPVDAPGHRQILFQLLDQLVPAASGAKATLLHAHNLRNKAEYDIGIPITQSIVDGVIAAAKNLLEEVSYLYKQWLKDLTAKQAAADSNGSGKTSQ